MATPQKPRFARHCDKITRRASLARTATPAKTLHALENLLCPPIPEGDSSNEEEGANSKDESFGEAEQNELEIEDELDEQAEQQTRRESFAGVGR